MRKTNVLFKGEKTIQKNSFCFRDKVSEFINIKRLLKEWGVSKKMAMLLFMVSFVGLLNSQTVITNITDINSKNSGDYICYTTLYVYPNPTSNNVEILSSNYEITILSCEVLNVTGNKLLSVNGSDNTLNLDLSSLENGVYFVRVRLSNQDIEMI